MPISEPKLKVVYIPHKTFRLISQMYDVVLGCLAYYVYFKAIQKIKTKTHNDWLIATHNAYYDLSILHWCMLFGSQHNEPTHFLHLAENAFNLSNPVSSLLKTTATKAALNNQILAKSKIKQSDFYKFKKNTIKYRNKNLIHREHNPNTIHDKCMHRPNTEYIIKSTFSLYNHIKDICESFPSSPDKQNKYLFAYRIFESRQMLSSYFLKTFPKSVINK